MAMKTPVNLIENGIKLTTMTFDFLPRAGEIIVIANDGSKHTVVSLGHNVRKNGQGVGNCESVDVFLKPS